MSAGRLQIQGLTKTFDRGRVRALDAVDLVVEAGRSTVVLGQSGSGKSTLLRIVAGLMRADAGRIILGERLLSDPALRVPPERRRIGMVFQALELWPHMTVAEHVAFGLPGRPRGRRARTHDAVQRLTAEVGLNEDLLARRPDTLSGGERQRVAIARTLAAEPDVILYDEPLASLDPDRRTSLRQLIKRLAAEHGTTLVYVTHDAEEAIEMGDQIVVFEGGRIAEQGDPESLYARPRTLAGARALGAVNAVEATVDAGRLVTPLGTLEPIDTLPGTASDVLAVLRPEQVALGEDGTPARIDVAHFHGGAWRFVARVGDVHVEGRSPTRVEPGADVRVKIEGKAAVISKEPRS